MLHIHNKAKGTIFIATASKKVKRKKTAGRQTLVPALPQACGAGADSI